jgi:hypothetical protein
LSQSALTELSFDDLRDLVRETGDGPLLEKADRFLGAALLVTAAATGQPGIIALLAPKDELVKIGKQLIRKLTGRPNESFLARHRRMVAAHRIVVYTAFFAAADDVLTPLRRSMKLTEADRAAIARKTSARLKRSIKGDIVGTSDESNQRFHILNDNVTLPHPAEGIHARREMLAELYNELTAGLSRFLDCIPSSEDASETIKAKVADQLDNLPAAAIEMYEAQLFALADEFPYFLTWLTLRGTEVSEEQMATLSKSVRTTIEHARATEHALDVGLAALGRQVRALNGASRHDEAQKVVEGLAKTYSSAIEARIIDDPQPDSSPNQLTYPKKSQSFVPQSFKVLRTRYTSSSAVRLEDEAIWNNQEAYDDIDAFLLGYLSSAYSVETPLIILGHPGSGKSLLTTILAARLATPTFNPVRIALRDVDVEQELQTQIEQQIRRDTGRRTDWVALSEEMEEAPPVVILDGFDELLQTTGRVHANYLAKVEAFQRREAVQGRPVRIIVTSRIALIDKAVVPPGATVVRLLEFDNKRIAAWVDIWNRHNTAYFASTGVRPFALPDHETVRELARQPLLLLMLALFDSDANQLHKEKKLDRTRLYDNLIRRFVERERLKGPLSDQFQSLSTADKGVEVDHDMQRLGVAAMSMFNRRTLHILRDELDGDIEYFGLEREVPDGFGAPLSQAELLLGGFFFVHESRARMHTEEIENTNAGENASAFEFLHATFGEFLTADFILSTLLSQATSLSMLGERSELRGEYEHKLAPGGLPKEWFVALMYTPLYTRPVILEMIREWTAHLLAHRKFEMEKFVAALDKLVGAQLRLLLEGNTAPKEMTSEGMTPYESLPLLGHYAVYSLNLVLMRTVVSEVPYCFDEPSMARHEGGARPWDQLTHLWRSWLAIDHLAGLGAIVDTERDEDKIVLRVKDRFEVSQRGGRLGLVWSASAALGDTLAWATIGLHAYDASLSGDVGLAQLNSAAQGEQLNLALEVHLRAIRQSGWGAITSDYPALIRHIEVAAIAYETSRSHAELLTMLSEVNAPAVLRFAGRRPMAGPDLYEMKRRPERFAIAHVGFCASVEPRWTLSLLGQLASSEFMALAYECPHLAATLLDLVPVGWRDDAEWRVLEDLTEAGMHPDVYVAAVLAADRVGVREIFAGAVEGMLMRPPEAVIAEVWPRRLRRLVALAERRDVEFEIAAWLSQANGSVAEFLPLDISLDLSRLGVAAPGLEREFDYGSSMSGATDPAESAAWLRLYTERRFGRRSRTRLGRRHVMGGVMIGDISELPLRSLPALADLARTGESNGIDERTREIIRDYLGR